MSTLNDARHEWIDLFVLDVEQYPSAYKEAIREQPSLHAMRVLVGMDEAEVRNLTRNLRAERARVKASQ